MAKPYFNLLQYDPAVYEGGLVVHQGMWFHAFGDYERGTVESERDYIRDSEMIPLKRFRIVRTNDSQAAIDAAIREANNP